MYERNLNALHKALRNEFDAPKAPMVIATLGQTNKDSATSTEKQIIDGMYGFVNSSQSDRGIFYTHPVSKGGASNSHYGNHAQTYMSVGLGMGAEMVKLLK